MDVRAAIVSGDSRADTLPQCHGKLERFDVEMAHQEHPRRPQASGGLTHKLNVSGPAITQPSRSEREKHDDERAAVADKEMPALFATSVPANGLTTSLQAVAALIDEEDAMAAPTAGCSEFGHERSHRKRSRTSMGEAQVTLALTSCDDGPSQRRRTASPDLYGGTHASR